ncbi:MAG: FAD-dependent oxidoreductase [Pirellulaceae bacterium]|nr:FAD-dependent oxidoreductase [Pirellulaceae bacterium]
MNCRFIYLMLFWFIAVPFASDAQDSGKPPILQGPYDVVIYGATSAGISAAIQVARMNGRVILIEPSRRLGGLTTGGLGQTDIGNKAAIGGISREFYCRVKSYYEKSDHWRYQKASEYRSGGQSQTRKDEQTMWTFEPSAALQIMQEFLEEHKVTVLFEARLDRRAVASGVNKRENRIESIVLEDGRTIQGKMFIDATYEGDFLAAAGVEYTTGRESNSAYGETLNGVQTEHSVHHQFSAGVDPYIVQGDATSGLLPGIDPSGPGQEGESDRRIQAYCFRMCMTDHPDNRIPFSKPATYSDRNYELMFRNFEAGEKRVPLSIGRMPNRKTDANNNYGFSTDFIGQNYDYPEASYAERTEITNRQREYQQGLMWALANHHRVPEKIRREVSRWGMCKDEFERTDGWQQQLYVREARRMVGELVMTQHHCQGHQKAQRPIGLAAYTMDSHNVQRYVDQDGFVRNEGDVQVGGFSPYAIDLGALLPKRQQCRNLIVPICLSASHIAFGSIRMEPVFMVLGQSGATVAMHAIEADCAVQDIDYEKLKATLEKDNQRLAWKGPVVVTPVGRPVGSFKGLVLDDSKAKRIGFETSSRSVGPFVGLAYRHDGDQGKGLQELSYRFQLENPGKYEVLVAYTPHDNRASKVPIIIKHSKGTVTRFLDQTRKPTRAPFGSLGVFSFEEVAVVRITNEDTDGYVIGDAVQLLPVDQ